MVWASTRGLLPYPDLPRRIRTRRQAFKLITCKRWPGEMRLATMQRHLSRKYADVLGGLRRLTAFMRKPHLYFRDGTTYLSWASLALTGWSSALGRSPRTVRASCQLSWAAAGSPAASCASPRQVRTATTFTSPISR
jgi:hypothetical protein